MKKFLLISFFCLLHAICLKSQNCQFVRYYSNNNSSYNQPVIDTQGNIYAGGTTAPGSNVDVLLSKYNPAGQLIWSFSFGGSGYDACWSMKMDYLDNIYISGTFTASITIGSQTLNAPA